MNGPPYEEPEGRFGVMSKLMDSWKRLFTHPEMVIKDAEDAVLMDRRLRESLKAFWTNRLVDLVGLVGKFRQVAQAKILFPGERVTNNHCSGHEYRRTLVCHEPNPAKADVENEPQFDV